MEIVQNTSPTSQKKKSKAGIIIFIIVLILLLLCGCSILGTVWGFGRIRDSVEKTNKVEIYNIFDEVNVGGLKYQVKSVHNLGKKISAGVYTNYETEGNFIKVVFEVENTSSEASFIDETIIEDSQGRVYEDSGYRYLVDDDNSSTTSKINPGIKITRTEVYELPEGAYDLRLGIKKVHIVISMCI